MQDGLLPLLAQLHLLGRDSAFGGEWRCGEREYEVCSMVKDVFGSSMNIGRAVDSKRHIGNGMKGSAHCTFSGAHCPRRVEMRARRAGTSYEN